MSRVRARFVLCAFVSIACTDDRPRDVPGGKAVPVESVHVDTRRATVKNDKLAWGGYVLNMSDRYVRGVDVTIAGIKDGRTPLGTGKGHVDFLPPHYGTRIEINGVDLSSNPALIDVAIAHVDVAPDEKPIVWQLASIEWKTPLPEGTAFAAEKDDKCAGHLGKKGEPTIFRCILGIKLYGKRTMKNLKLAFEPVRGGAPIPVQGAPTDLPIEPGDALVFRVDAPMTTPSEMILRGTVESR